jgi:hypothetical protein
MCNNDFAARSAHFLYIACSLKIGLTVEHNLVLAIRIKTHVDDCAPSDLRA